MTRPSAATASADADKRASPRRWRLQSGRISAADGAFSVPCTIVDLSDDGARVRIEQTLNLPPTVFLIDARDRVAYTAVPVWSAQLEHGLQFLMREPL